MTARLSGSPGSLLLGKICGLNGSASLALVHLFDDLFSGNGSLRQEVLEQADDIGAAKQRLAVVLGGAFFGHEQHGDQHHCHVMVLSEPEPSLVIRHAAVALGILKRALHPEALALHDGQAAK